MVKVSTNKIYAGIHWSGRSELKQNYRYIALAGKGLAKITAQPVKLLFTFYFKGNLLDASNCSLMGKLLEDALVKNGVLIEDKPKYVSSVEYVSKKGKSDKITLDIIVKGKKK